MLENVFAAYENYVMGSRLGRFKVAKKLSDRLYFVLFVWKRRPL